MSDMEPSAAPALRWARAVLLTAVSMVSGVVAHVSAGGLMPGPTAALLLCGLCLGAVGSLLGRPASTLRIVGLLIAGQMFIHGALTALAGHRGDPLPAGSPTVDLARQQLDVYSGRGRRTGSLHDQLYPEQHEAAPTLTVPAPVQHLVEDVTGPHAVMALAHLAAAVAIGLWLAMGERALWTVIALTAVGLRDVVRHVVATYYALVGALSRLVAAVRLPARAGVPAVEADCLPSLGVRLSRSLVRRGPPPLLAA
jgi:hypothetical protein